MAPDVRAHQDGDVPGRPVPHLRERALMSTAACVGCLDTRQCWICSGDGCHRCDASGACHVCREAVLALRQLVPRQTAPSDDLLPRGL